MNRAILIFIATAYALSIVLSLVVGLTGANQSPLIGLGIISMFVPAIAVLVVQSALNEPPRVDWVAVVGVLRGSRLASVAASPTR